MTWFRLAQQGRRFGVVLDRFADLRGNVFSMILVQVYNVAFFRCYCSICHRVYRSHRQNLPKIVWKTTENPRTYGAAGISKVIPSLMMQVLLFQQKNQPR